MPAKKKIDPNDKALNDWLNAQKKQTRYQYKSHWRRFAEYTGMNGDQILEDRKKDKEHKWERKILAFKEWLLTEKGLSEYSATANIMAIRGFFAFYYVDLKYRRTEAERLGERTRKTEDYQFMREELQYMAKIGNLQEEYVIVVGKSFGLRAGDFLKLTRGDLEPYLDREIPISIGELGTKKRKAKACPFIDADALPVIKKMIRQMDIEGRTAPTERILTFKTKAQLSNILKSVAVRAGINPGNKIIRFHCLRKYLSDRLASYMAESKWKQIIGKRIDEKAYISPDLLRNDYIRTMADTCWTGILGDVEKRVKIELLKAKAKDLGLTEADIKDYLTKMDLDEFDEFLHKQAVERSKQPIGGGLPFETQAKKALAEIILGAFEEIKKKQKNGETS